MVIHFYLLFSFPLNSLLEVVFEKLLRFTTTYARPFTFSELVFFRTFMTPMVMI